MSNRIKLTKLLILITIVPCTQSWAEQGAKELFAAKEWSAAMLAYQDRLRANPSDATAWFQLAVSARHVEDYSLASSALTKSAALEYSPRRIALERARLNVLASDTNAAIADLKAIAEQGFSAANLLTDDPVLGTLIGVEQFDALISEMKVRAYPCEHDNAFGQFDFWIGEWDVFTADGLFAGSNTVSREERGCVLFERWMGASGSRGSSINFLDKITAEWVQIWNSESGTQINIRGGVTVEGMLLTGTIHTISNNTTLPFRGLWTPMPDGRVRQFFEQSTDNGKTWTAWFEGFYTRKGKE